MAGGRRDKGSGGLSKLADGAWQASYYDAQGTRRFLRGRTQREAREKLAAAIRAAESGGAAAPSKERVGEYLTRWLDIIKGSVTERTHRGYRDHIEKRIAPALGAVRLQALSETQIDRFYARLGETKLAPATVRRIHATLHVALEYARRRKLIPHNPASDATLPRAEAYEGVTLTEAQVRQVFVATKDEPLYPLWVTAIMTGMRQGELFALQWRDIDFERGIITVNRALPQDTKEFKDTKGRQRRSVPVDREITLAALEAQRRALLYLASVVGDKWAGLGLVFPSNVGAPRTSVYIYRQWRRACERAGVPAVRFHDTRHTTASLWLAAGVPVPVVSERLGHSSPVITLRTYSHVLPSMQAEAANEMARRLRMNG